MSPHSMNSSKLNNCLTLNPEMLYFLSACGERFLTLSRVQLFNPSRPLLADSSQSSAVRQSSQKNLNLWIRNLGGTRNDEEIPISDVNHRSAASCWKCVCTN